MTGRDTANIAAVRAYLKAEFPEPEIEDWRDDFRDAHYFLVRERGLATLVVTQEVLDDSLTADLQTRLLEWQVAGSLRTAGVDRVVVITTQGLRVESQRPS